MLDPTVHPFHLHNIITPALDGIVRAISDRGGQQTDADRRARGDAALVQIMSFMPVDVAQMMLAGQAVLFNELLADGARDVLRGMETNAKQKGLAGLINIGRLTQGHLDRLKVRRNAPHRTEAREPDEQTFADPAQVAKEAAVPKQPRPAAARAPVAAKAEPRTAPVQKPPAATQVPVTSAEETEETSWLDTPHEEWLIETPADRSFRTAHPCERPGETAMETAAEPSAHAPAPPTPVPVMREAAGD